MWDSIASIAGNVVDQGLDLFNKHQAYSHADFWNNQNIALQKEFAQNSIRWRVEDAMRAGVHPMAALGISPSSFSPVSSTVSAPSPTNFMSELGQNVDRAIMQGKTEEERKQTQEISDKLLDIKIRKGEADAELAETEAASARFRLQQQLFPSPPSVNKSPNLIGGQGNAPYSPDYPYGKDLYTLFTIARHGDTLYEVPHPDIADSITETEWKNILSSIDAEIQAETGVIKPPVYKLTPHERKLVREHKAELVRIPGVGWKLDRNPSRPHPLANLSEYERFNRRNTQRWHGKQQVSGPILD